jgi:hypothetical protein
LIDWAVGSITFRTPTVINSTVLATDIIKSQATSTPSASPDTSAIPKVSLIDAGSFLRASKMEGSRCYSISLKVDEATGCFAAPVSEPIADLEGVPEKYHDFTDVFSKQKADKLAPHRPYDLKST